MAPRLKSELEQEFALRHRPEGVKPEVGRGLLERGEIDMGGDVDLAWARQGIGEAVAMDGLQRVADAGLDMAVIGDQRGDRRLLGPFGEG